MSESALAQALQIPPISPFDPGNWEAALAAFAHVPTLEMQQAWLPEPEANFRSGAVRLGWRDGELLVLAELVDDNIYTDAKENQQRLWMLGDTFEIFVRRSRLERYFEMHVAPNNLTLQLRLENRYVFRGTTEDGAPVTLESLMCREPVMRSWTKVEDGRWWVLAILDAAILSSPDSAGDGSEWAISFSRYDYSRGQEPVLSSTSHHTVKGFHIQADWTRMVCTH